MSRRVLTPTERQARIVRRAAIRQAAADRVADLRAWRERRAADARKRVKEAHLTQQRADVSRGIDRVPGHLLDTFPTVGKHSHGKRPGSAGELFPIDSTPGEIVVRGKSLSANHDERRRMGQRGKARPRRVRELPGAEARRIERNRKAWSA